MPQEFETVYDIIEVPIATPVTIPVVPTLALVLLLLHVPPPILLMSVVVKPTHTADVPVIVSALGKAFIVTVFVADAVPHKLVTEYITVSIPAATPITIPVVPIDAFALLIHHVPPDAASVKVRVEPTHTVDNPVIVPALGSGFTVTNLVATAVPQLFVTVYEMIEVPADTPLTIPETEPIVAIAVLVEDQIPPKAKLPRVMVAEAHKDEAPVIAPALGNGFIEIVFVAVAVPQTLVTEYITVSIPAVTPVTIPVLPIEASALLILHVPPIIASVIVVVELTHNVDAPLTIPALGNGLTATVAILVAVPQPLVMV